MRTKRRLIQPLLPAWRDERGGAAVLLLALLAILSLTAIWLASVNWSKQTLGVNKAKPILDLATRAASLDIDREALGEGKLVWDEEAGRRSFTAYLNANLRLNDDGSPLAGSMLAQKPVIHTLEFVSAPAYPVSLHRSLILYEGSADETVRTIDVTVYGPSVVAIAEFRISAIGSGNLEPIVMSSVSSVRYR